MKATDKTTLVGLATVLAISLFLYPIDLLVGTISPFLIIIWVVPLWIYFRLGRKDENALSIIPYTIAAFIGLWISGKYAWGNILDVEKICPEECFAGWGAIFFTLVLAPIAYVFGFARKHIKG